MSTDELRKGRHCVHTLHVHLVFLAKYRKNIFNLKILTSMEEIFKKVCKEFEADLQEFKGEESHVHLMVTYPPKLAISVLVNSLKGVSSRLLRQEFEILRSKLWKKALWSPSYFAGSCGGVPLDVVIKYIENQNTPK